MYIMAILYRQMCQSIQFGRPSWNCKWTVTVRVCKRAGARAYKLVFESWNTLYLDVNNELSAKAIVEKQPSNNNQ